MDGYWNVRGNSRVKSASPYRGSPNVIRRHWLLILVVFLIVLIVLCGVIMFELVFIPFLSEKPHRDFRLPLSLIPEHYSLEIQPYMAPDNLTFEGVVVITVICKQVTNNVTLHAFNLTIHEVSVKPVQKYLNSPEVKRIEEDDENQFLILHMSGNFQAGRSYEIRVRFSSSLNDSNVGFYWSSYVEDGIKHYLAVTHFQPIDARRCFPCFDEPALKATFDITVIRWRNMTSLSNMPRRKTESRGEEWEADVYHTSVKMSTYLVAFFIGNFTKNGNEKFAVWTSRSNITRTQFALEVGIKFLEYFENILGIPYSLPKLDMIAVPEHKSSAMENWGLIVYQGSYILYDPENSTDAEKQFAARIIAHEISHQWFGNLVTPKWWQDIWLSEGLATYMEHLAIDAMMPGWNMVNGLVRSVEDIASNDCSDHSIPVSLKVDRSTKLIRLFNSFTYKKGGMIIRMVHHILGNETFWNGLSNYVKEKSFDNAEEDDLWKYFTEAQPNDRGTRIEIKRIMESWTHNRGYPVVKVERDYDNGRALLTQQSCLTKSLKDKNFVSVWKIPLTYTDGKNPDWTPKVRKWLNSIKGTLFNLPGQEHWILMNIQQVGYYHVIYDTKNWQLLSVQLQTNHTVIPLVNRRQLLKDVADFIREKMLTYDMILEMSIFLRYEKEAKVLEILSRSPLLDMNMIVRHTRVLDNWKSYVYSVIGPIHEFLGWEENVDESFHIQSLRAKLIEEMCKYDYPSCVHFAMMKYKLWINKEEDYKAYFYPVIRTVFCVAVREGNETDWNNVLKLLKQSRSDEGGNLIYALGCSTNDSLITRYLENLLQSNTYRISYLDNLFESILKNEIAWTILFDYLDQNWNNFKKRYYHNVTRVLFTSMRNIKELQELKDVFQRHNESLSEREPTKYKKVEKILKQRQNHLQSIEDWLELRKWKTLYR